MRCSTCTVLLVLVTSGCLVPRRDHFRYESLAPAIPARATGGGGEPGVRVTSRELVIPAGPISLEAAIELGLERNPDIQLARHRIVQAAAARKEAAASFLPLLSTDVAYLRADAPSMYLFKTIDSRKFQAGTDFNNPGAFDNFETGVSFRYNLYNGGRDLLQTWIRETDEVIRELDHDSTRNVLVASVILAYYDVLLAAEIVRTSQASEETVRAQLRETEAKWKAGLVLKSDVLSLEVRLAEDEERTIRAENGRKLAVAALANLLGADADTQLELADGGWEAEAVPGEYPAALAEALSLRPELMQARRRVEQRALELSSARRAFLPRLDAEGRAYWDDPEFSYSGDRTNWFVGVALSWNIFEGGRRFATVAKAKAALDEMLEADRKAALAVQLDVKRAYLALDEARARVKVTEASVAQAEETLSLVRKQYEGGTATVTRYLESQLAVTQARMRQFTAVFDLKKALAEAARSVGRFTEGDAYPDAGGGAR